MKKFLDVKYHLLSQGYGDRLQASAEMQFVLREVVYSPKWLPGGTANLEQKDMLTISRFVMTADELDFLADRLAGIARDIRVKEGGGE
jgi:hypothetical protein